ncbi:MAG TPA: HIT family protein [Anaerolineae bacterium]|nr:HIT family protein [Anaerolineae bacterium]HNT06216.1 HIT family protein [Anaerolineae bacterium]
MEHQETSSDRPCIFCRILAGKAPAVRVYEDEYTLAFMDINPSTRGHVLVVPKVHARDLLDVSEEDLQHVISTVQRVALAVEKALHPDGINLFHATRRAAFQSVFHFHIHVVPRWWNDGLRAPWSVRAGDPAEIEAVGALIRQVLESPPPA